MAKNSALLADLAAGILGGGIRVVDLTVPLEPATPTIQLPPIFAPSKPFSLEEISHYDDRGPAWYWNNIACGEHTGTHFDAPIHWVTGKDYPNNATHNIPVQKFIGPACVIDVTERVRENVDFLVTVDVVKAWEQQHGEIPRGAWVLIRTAGQAATFDPMFPCHTIMHGSNRFGLASLMNLDQLPPTGAIVIAPPLKIVNGSGSPLRVLALVPN
jgi:kynurenine formamidase